MKAPENKGLDIVDQTMGNKLELIGRELGEIETELESRYALHKDIETELSDTLMELRRKADNCPCIGANSYFQKQRDDTEHTMREIDRELRLVKQSLWKDSQMLKEQRRRLQKEYDATKQKKLFFEDNLKGGIL
jgi:excinuclease UvrABC helicase subunit UvrB